MKALGKNCDRSASVLGLGALDKVWIWYLSEGLVTSVALLFLGVGSLAFGADNRNNDLTELSLEDLSTLKVQTVFGASRHDQVTTDAPSAVSIVTRDEIQQFGYRTLADILRSVRGVYATYDRKYNFLGVNGMNRTGDFGGRTLIMVDGHRINDPIYDGNFAGTEFPLDVDLIERVEVIRGPGSSLYGNNAFFGVINVVTRRSEAIHGAEVSGAVASDDDYRARITYGQTLTNGLSLRFSGSYFDRGGDKHLYYKEFDQRVSNNSLATNNGNADNRDGEHTKSFFLSLEYKDFSIEGGYADREKVTPTAPYGALFNNRDYELFDERAFLDLKFQRDLGNDWQLMARTYFDHYRFDAFAAFPYNYEDPPMPGLRTLNSDLDIARSVGAEMQASTTQWDKHRVTFGTEVRWDPQLQLRNWDDAPAAEWLNIHEDALTVGAYAQDEFEIFSNLLLNAGLRYDWFSFFGDTLNPRGALIYKPWHQGAFKFIYGQAYRAPNVYEWGFVTEGYKTIPDLRPESIRTYEVVYEQGLGSHVRFSAGLFLNQVKDQIVQVYDPTDGLYYDRNLDEAESRGVEAELELKMAYGIRARLSYTYAEARDTRADLPLSNSPAHLGKFNLVVPVCPDRVFAGFELQAMSDRVTERGNRASGFAVANVTLFSRRLVNNLELTAGVYNLFDTRYRDPVPIDFTQDTIEQDGRSFRVKLTYRF